ncbi:DinB family protein [Alicyclobacillus dauci]|uniref:DinB family protein n=1 Tax=Alicyclobacillus dauci TaxID=1475485 RepID=A0ABY6Z2P9_9BACL|nr:DinB family protein [Alicyclobacillus dauci]WAH36260.1 DinB family protein [Alicyclobacillus dauci]WAH39418.1 DinB family protein [Alicyclobacillus dauci]
MEFDWKTWFIDVWEDNRRLTNNVARTLVAAEAMDKVLVEGMRPFRELLLEILGMERWNVRGLAYDQWEYEAPPEVLRTAPVAEVLDYGTIVREETRQLWPNIPFAEFVKMRPSPAPFVPEGTAIERLTYTLENEIHHRGQGYVYVRLLGQEPPAFFMRQE